MSSIIDEKDLEILKMLESNARIPLTRIAEKIGMSDVAIRKRLKKLEDEGIIKAYRLRLDHTKLGYRARAIIGFNVEASRLLEVVRTLSENPNVKFVAITSGDHMVVADCWARDNMELEAFVNELKTKFNIRDLMPSLVLEMVKE
ncbi:MAG: Lrp/AsnC family transcriptional regulator [Thermofilaceae archaeon]|nr:Lrp/AsnC family transcriptional regulator [Thermofilaceae archaeon]MCX8180196.1 Lrp/AsnC family transcriptional regulator [Thermofilaceae archaeon]MDW8004148.1 Lrp/AsnC family transcriptional regulator [Thermofilaceae archaeon]